LTVWYGGQAVMTSTLIGGGIRDLIPTAAGWKSSSTGCAAFKSQNGELGVWREEAAQQELAVI